MEWPSDALRDIGPVEQRARRWENCGSWSKPPLRPLVLDRGGQGTARDASAPPPACAMHAVLRTIAPHCTALRTYVLSARRNACRPYLHAIHCKPGGIAAWCSNACSVVRPHCDRIRTAVLSAATVCRLPCQPYCAARSDHYVHLRGTWPREVRLVLLCSLRATTDANNRACLGGGDSTPPYSPW